MLISKPNAEAITHAPRDIAYLVAEVKRLQASNERLRKHAAVMDGIHERLREKLEPSDPQAPAERGGARGE